MKTRVGRDSVYPNETNVSFTQFVHTGQLFHTCDPSTPTKQHLRHKLEREKGELRVIMCWGNPGIVSLDPSPSNFL